MRERFLEFTQLGKSYDTPHGPAVIVKDFNLRMHEGEFVCIIGHSGNGNWTIIIWFYRIWESVNISKIIGSYGGISSKTNNSFIRSKANFSGFIVNGNTIYHVR